MNLHARSRNVTKLRKPWAVPAALLLAAVIASPAAALVGPTVVLERGSFDLQADISTGNRDIDLTGRVGQIATIRPVELIMDQTELDLRARYAISSTLYPYLLLGSSSMDVGTLDFGSGLGSLNMKGDFGLTWGVGADYLFPRFGSMPDLHTGIMLEYRNLRSDIVGGQLEADEFTVALKALRRFDRFGLYGGVNFVFFDGNFQGTSTQTQTVAGEFESANPFGLYLGGDYAFSEKVSGRIEGRILDEKTINAGVVYHFSPGAPAPPRAPTAAPPPPTRTPPVTTPERVEMTRPPAVVVPPVPQIERRDVRAAQEQIELGNQLAALGRPGEAASYYRRAVELDPGNFRARYNLGTVRYQMKDYTGARDAYRDALAIDPNDVEAHLYLGFSLYRLGDIKGAIRSWERVLQLDPANTVALNNLQALGR